MTALIIVKAGGDPTDDGVPKTTDEPKAGTSTTSRKLNDIRKLSAGRAGLMKVIVQQGSRTAVKRSGYDLELLLRCFEHAESENVGKQLVIDALSRSNNPILLAPFSPLRDLRDQAAGQSHCLARALAPTRVAVGLVEHMSLKETIVALHTRIRSTTG